MNRRSFLKKVWLSGGAIFLSKWQSRQAHAAVLERTAVIDRITEKIDSYCHFSTMKIIDFLETAGGPKPHVFRRLFANTPTLINSDKRLQLMDDFNVIRSVLVPLPWLETAPAGHIPIQRAKADAAGLKMQIS